MQALHWLNNSQGVEEKGSLIKETLSKATENTIDVINSDVDERKKDTYENDTKIE